MSNAGSGALQLTVYVNHLSGAPAQRFDVAPGGAAKGSFALTGTYDVWVHGPNRFLHHAAGNATPTGVEASLKIVGAHARPAFSLVLTNGGRAAATVEVTGAGSRPQDPYDRGQAQRHPGHRPAADRQRLVRHHGRAGR
jgi:hypothetical protein